MLYCVTEVEVSSILDTQKQEGVGGEQIFLGKKWIKFLIAQVLIEAPLAKVTASGLLQ